MLVARGVRLMAEHDEGLHLPGVDHVEKSRTTESSDHGCVREQACLNAEVEGLRIDHRETVRLEDALDVNCVTADASLPARSPGHENPVVRRRMSVDQALGQSLPHLSDVWMHVMRKVVVPHRRG